MDGNTCLACGQPVRASARFCICGHVVGTPVAAKPMAPLAAPDPVPRPLAAQPAASVEMPALPWASPVATTPDEIPAPSAPHRRNDSPGKKVALAGLGVAVACLVGVLVVTSGKDDDSPAARSVTPVSDEAAALATTAETDATSPIADAVVDSPVETTPAPSVASEPVVPVTTVAAVAVVESAAPPAETAPATTVAPVAAPVETVAPVTTPPPLIGDLGLAAGITQPVCDGSFIVLVGASVTPDLYTSQIQQLLGTFGGSSYLRTDQVCSSLRPAVDGNAIYVVYFGPYATGADACAVRNNVGGDAYVKMLDTFSPDDHIVPC